MKYRNIIIITGISLSAYLMLFVFDQKVNSPWRIPDSSVGLDDAIPIQSAANRLAPPEDALPKNVVTRDLKVIANTNKEVEELSSKFYNEIFSIVGIEQGYMHEVQAGKSIDVISFYDPDDKPSQFVPLYANRKVVGVAVFREYNVGEKKLGMMVEIKDDWYLYPPIPPYESELEINTRYPSINHKRIPGYYYIEDGETPYYLYEGIDGYLTTYYLVNSYNKNIVVKENRRINEDLVEPRLPLKMSSDGLLELDYLMFPELSELPPDELTTLVDDLALTNKYIQDGLMGFDEDFNVIFDRRNEALNGSLFSTESDETYYNPTQSYNVNIESSEIQELLFE
jgi:hypothetical protein